MSERELMKELSMKFASDYDNSIAIVSIQELCNWIMNDRERIIKPLRRKFIYQEGCLGCNKLAKSGLEAIKLAGLEEKE